VKRGLLERVRKFADLVPSDAPGKFYDKEVERSLIVEPLSSLDGAFWKFLLMRKVTRFGNRKSSAKLIKFSRKHLLPELLRHALRGDDILQLLNSMYTNYQYAAKFGTAHELLDSFLNRTVTREEGILISVIFRILRRKFVLSCLAHGLGATYASPGRVGALLEFFKEIGEFAGRKQKQRTGTEVEARKLEQFIVNAASRGSHFLLRDDERRLALRTTEKKLVNFVASTVVSSYEHSEVASIAGAFYLPIVLTVGLLGFISDRLTCF
jgi:hypothetical protein